MDKLDSVLSDDFIKGLKKGLEIAQNVATRQGFELTFPDVDEMLIEKEDKQN